MAGLLDFLSTPESALGLGLLAAAQSGQGFGPGLLQATQYAGRVRSDAEERDLIKRYRDSQIAENEAQARAKQQQVNAAQAKQAALPGLFQGASAAGGSTAGPGGPSGFNWQAALNAGYSPDEIQKLSGLTSLGRAKVARTIESTDAQGRPVTLQLDEFGEPIGQGLASWKAPLSVNQGDRTTFVDPVSLATRGSFGVNMSAAERDASARGWAGNAIARERLAMDRSDVGPGGAKAPAGYRWSAGGTLEAIPGGPASDKPLNDTQSKALLFGARMSEADKLINNLSVGGKDFSTPGSNAGFGVGSLVNMVNTSQGQQLDQAKRDFINAVLRRESGAAIGKDEYINAEKQYFPQIGEGKEVIEQKARNRALATQGIIAEVPGGAGRVYGLQSAASNRPANMPMKGQVVQGYRFKGGDPSNQANWEKQ